MRNSWQLKIHLPVRNFIISPAYEDNSFISGRDNSFSRPHSELFTVHPSIFEQRTGTKAPKWQNKPTYGQFSIGHREGQTQLGYCKFWLAEMRDDLNPGEKVRIRIEWMLKLQLMICSKNTTVSLMAMAIVLIFFGIYIEYEQCYINGYKEQLDKESDI